MRLRLSPGAIARVLRNLGYVPGRDLQLPYRVEMDPTDYPLGTALEGASLVVALDFGLPPLFTINISTALSADGQITDDGSTDGIGALYFAIDPSRLLPYRATGPLAFEVVVTDGRGFQGSLDAGALFAAPSTAGNPVDHIIVAPKLFAVQDPNTEQLTVTAYDANGNVLAGRIINWTSGDPTVATIDRVTGLVTGIGAGDVLFTATIEGRSDTSTGSFTTNATVVAVAPNPVANLPVTATQQLTATARDAGGAIVPNQTFDWSSSDPALATVDQAGVVTGVAQGQVTITATIHGTALSGTSTVNVWTEVGYLRSVIVGGDVGILALYSARSGATQAGGIASAWADLRGNGFGPTLTPGGSGGLSVVGSDPATLYLRSDAGRQMASGVSAVLDPSKVKALVSVNTMNAPSPATFALLLANAGLTHLLILDEEDFGETGHVLVTVDGPITKTRRVKGPKLKLFVTGRDGATVHAIEPPSADVTSAATVPVSENGQLFIGYNANCDEHWRAVLALDHIPSQAEIVALEQWARTYHGAATGSPHAIIVDGDSLAEGWTDPIASTVDCTHGWFPQLMLLPAYADYDEANQGVTSSFYNTATPNATFNLITRGPTWVDVAHRASRTREVLIVHCGTNDLSANRTSAQLLADAQTYVAARQAAGWTDIRLTTVIPRNFVSSQETNRVNYNAALIAAAASMGIRVINLSTHVAFNTPTAWQNATYYNPDGIHLTLAGYLAIRDVIDADLQAA